MDRLFRIAVNGKLEVEKLAGQAYQNAKTSQYFSVVVKDGFTLGENERLYVTFHGTENETQLPLTIGGVLLARNIANSDEEEYITLFPLSVIANSGAWEFSIEHRFNITETPTGATVYRSTTSAQYSFEIINSLVEIGLPFVTEEELATSTRIIEEAILRVQRGDFTARAFKEWSDYATYSAGDITAYLYDLDPSGVDYYKVLKSISDNNSTPPYIDGVFQSHRWALVSDGFDRSGYIADKTATNSRLLLVEQKANTTETLLNNYIPHTEDELARLDEDLNFVSGEQLRTAGELRLLQSVVAEQGVHAETVDSYIPETTTSVNKLVNQGQLLTAIRENAGNFRGIWDNWTSVPSSSEYYPADVYGFRVPTVNDDMTVKDASDYHSEEIMTKAGATTGKYLDALGVEHSNADFSISRFIELPHDGDKNIILTVATTLSAWTRVHAYNRAGEWLAEIATVQNGGDNQFTKTSKEIPASAVYIRVSYPTTATVSVKTAELVGSYRFIYTGTWATNGKAGWEPKEQLTQTALTEEEVQALHSGVTAQKVSQYDSAVESVEELNASANIIYVYDIDNNTLSLNGEVLTNERLKNDLKTGRVRCRAYSVERELFVDLSGYFASETVGEEIAEVAKLSASVKGATAVNIYTLSIVFAEGGGRTLNFSVDEISGGVTDVTIGGVSVVDENGTAVIPNATVNTSGVVVGDGAHGTQTSQGYVQIYQATETVLNNRKQTSYLGYRQPITNNNLDTAVKLAMGDGKGSAWNYTEQTNAQDRIGFEIVVLDNETDIVTANLYGNKSYILANPVRSVEIGYTVGNAREYHLTFNTEKTASATYQRPNIVFPAGTRWEEGELPDWEWGKVYEVSIQFGNALVKEFGEWEE